MMRVMRTVAALIGVGTLALGLVPTGTAASSSGVQTDPPGPLAGVRVNIDPGHNGANAANARKIARLVDAGPIRKACDTVGAATSSGTKESTINYRVARELQRELEARGAVVALTRPNDRGWGPCINRRAAIGNRSDLAISIHADGNLGRSARGFHVIKPQRMEGYTDDIASESGRLALHVRGAMDRTGIPRSNYIGRDGLDTRGDLGGLNLSNVPKVFVEMGNLRHRRDARALTRPAMQRRIGLVLADAVVAFHNEQ